MDKIKAATGYTLEEIKKMSSRDFVSKLAMMQVTGQLSSEQYIWLEKQREDPVTQEALRLFNGTKI